MTTEPKFMLDTNICIYIHRQKPASVLAHFESMKPGQIGISVITWGELLYGAAKSQRAKAVTELLTEFAVIVPVLPLPKECGKYYGKIRADLEKRGLPIGNNDLWIASHAVASGVTLVTNNVKEFKRIPHLRIENWV